jgi:EAL domain-containing protein (putative c-di-GMP-specific phosphodiesterase class I)
VNNSARHHAGPAVGKALIDFLDKAQSSSRIVIEITEKLVIDNYGLFRETMSYFTDLGMSFAVDDVGAGYSGLESIAQDQRDDCRRQEQQHDDARELVAENHECRHGTRR